MKFSASVRKRLSWNLTKFQLIRTTFIPRRTSLKIGRDCEHMTFFGISSKWLLFLLIFLPLLFFLIPYFSYSLLSLFLTFIIPCFSYSILSLFLSFLIPCFPYSLLSLRQTKLNKSKLVLNNPVNSRHTKLNKSKLVLKSKSKCTDEF